MMEAVFRVTSPGVLGQTKITNAHELAEGCITSLNYSWFFFYDLGFAYLQVRICAYSNGGTHINV